MAEEIKTAKELNDYLEEMEVQMNAQRAVWMERNATGEVFILENGTVTDRYLVAEGVENGGLCFGSEDPKKAFHNMTFKIEGRTVEITIECPSFRAHIDFNTITEVRGMTLLAVPRSVRG